MRTQQVIEHYRCHFYNRAVIDRPEICSEDMKDIDMKCFILLWLWSGEFVNITAGPGGEGGGGRRRVTHDKSASKPTTRQDIRPPLQPQLWPADQLQYHNMCNYNYNYNYQPSLWCNNTGSHQAKPVTSCGGESNQSSVDEKVWFHLIKYQSVVCQGLRPFILYIMGQCY